MPDALPPLDDQHFCLKEGEVERCCRRRSATAVA
jgi:hypothetical protein